MWNGQLNCFALCYPGKIDKCTAECIDVKLWNRLRKFVFLVCFDIISDSGKAVWIVLKLWTGYRKFCGLCCAVNCDIDTVGCIVLMLWTGYIKIYCLVKVLLIVIVVQ